MKGQDGKIELGVVKTFASRPGEPLDPEQWAEIITNNIMTIADSTQEPLRTMALDLRDSLVRVLTHYIGEIRKEQLAYLNLKRS